MNKWILALTVATLTVGSFAATPAHAQQYGTRQYYGDWKKHSTGYAYRTYYYKPSKDYGAYKHHYVIHHPKKPDYHYYYNPYTKKYWGRCPSTYGDKPVYSMLAEKDRKADLEQIPESAFPKPSAPPGIPESNDGATLDLPPDDLPDVSGLPAASGN